MSVLGRFTPLEAFWHHCCIELGFRVAYERSFQDSTVGNATSFPVNCRDLCSIIIIDPGQSTVFSLLQQPHQPKTSLNARLYLGILQAQNNGLKTQFTKMIATDKAKISDSSASLRGTVQEQICLEGIKVT